MAVVEHGEYAIKPLENSLFGLFASALDKVGVIWKKLLSAVIVTLLAALFTHTVGAAIFLYAAICYYLCNGFYNPPESESSSSDEEEDPSSSSEEEDEDPSGSDDEEEDPHPIPEDPHAPHLIAVVIRPHGGGADIFLENITDPLGYTSLASAIQDLSDDVQLQLHFPHVLWPWSNFRATYLAVNADDIDFIIEFPLDLLEDTWENFIGQLDKVVLQEEDDGERIIINAPEPADCFLLKKFLEGDRVKFYRVMQLCLYAYLNRDPPGNLWDGAGELNQISAEGLTFTFLDQQGLELPFGNFGNVNNWMDFERNLALIRLDLNIA